MMRKEPRQALISNSRGQIAIDSPLSAQLHGTPVKLFRLTMQTVRGGGFGINQSENHSCGL